MKIAVLSDIHGNCFALEAVLENAKANGVELLFNLGDIFYGPIAPRATWELLQSLSMPTNLTILTILGNQDRQILEATPAETAANPTMQFVLDDLGTEPLAWLASLPSLYCPESDILMCHGSPINDMEYLLEDVASGHPAMRSDDDITSSLAGRTEELILCGHTHIPRTVALGNGQLVVNPGSVGLPAYSDDEPFPHAMENFCPHASYALLEKNRKGWEVRQIKVPYDHHRAASLARQRQRDDWAQFLTSGRAE
ncbi:MAG: metallophosphoesterase family protein [Desulfovibrio sp.]|uniref:metallophosphoesterase family protein n=1 Tax=Desulfovibrio sp. 7SRBS1 TaxID=3378064 RepID=UPI003B3C0146